MESDNATSCANCGDELDEEELEGGYITPDGDKLCDECHKDIYQDICPICEEWYDKPETPTDHYFMLFTPCKDVQPGIYRALDYPIVHAPMFGRILLIEEENIELLKEGDPQELLRKEYPDLGKYDDRDYIHGAEIASVCKDCAERYSKSET